ncbi:zinc ribbon domain-containing protein [Candidatus Chloroploca sp. M-50]|uniref:Zinc ribbon domain-containing protein n=1 Tax=Candidatus Chloroploca mongolica TaxID=2528176 RepID=A0ABS4DA99_9CHLR|nr:zinc-ribbon domain-containing protein [Candidatus Chloroploca mongolica]MBP1466353.1 zinc ribbon domain-containing protein [Candidatus Chloroploca mongolica]
MGFLDQISKQISQGVDRAKFEAEKFQKTTRLQGEVNEVQRQVDTRMYELGQRAYELLRAGQIHSASLNELSAAIDQLRSSLIGKEEELKQAQAEVFVEPPPAPAYTPPPSSQQVPISYETPPTSDPNTPPPPTKVCGACGFQMPATAMFCPNCGSRVA